LRDGFNNLFERMNVPAQAVGPGSTFNVVFSREPIQNYRDAARADARARQLFDYGLVARGIHLHPDKPFYTCTAHTEMDIDTTLNAAEEVLKRMK
jgi:glutamate-1-semialdehyde 2,1-aminomutase